MVARSVAARWGGALRLPALRTPPGGVRPRRACARALPLRCAGVRVYYTKKLRPYETGMFVLGDLFMSLQGKPLHDGLSHVQVGRSA